MAMTSPKVGMKSPKVGMKAPKVGMKAPKSMGMIGMKAPKSGIKAPKMAMKSPRVQLPIAPLLMDEDDDLCPVCDGDCTCNAKVTTPPIAKPIVPLPPPPVSIPFKQGIPTPHTSSLKSQGVKKPVIVKKPVSTTSSSTTASLPKPKPIKLDISAPKPAIKPIPNSAIPSPRPLSSTTSTANQLIPTIKPDPQSTKPASTTSSSSSSSAQPLHQQPQPKTEDIRRMISCTADIVVDKSGVAWKARTSLKKAGVAREFGKMTHTPSSEVLKKAPRIEKVGGIWVVAGAAGGGGGGGSSAGSSSSGGPAVVVKKQQQPKSIKNSIFDSSSDSEDDVPIRLQQQQQHSKVGNKGMKSKPAVVLAASSTSSDSSSDMDEKALVFSDSDLDSGPLTERRNSLASTRSLLGGGDTDESGNELLSVEMTGPPFVEQHTTDDDSDDDSTSDSDSDASVESLADFLSEHSEDMEIDMIFANAETETGSDASESDIDMFVENALYGGWSSSDEFEDSDEDSVFGMAESEAGSAPSVTHSEENVLFHMDFGTDPSFLLSDPVATSHILDGFTTISTDIHTLDPVLDDPLFFGTSGTDVISSTSTSVPMEDVSSTASIIPAPALTPAPVQQQPAPKPLVSFDITQTHIGPNGEIITTTKQLTLPVQKPKPPKKKLKGSNLKNSIEPVSADKDKKPVEVGNSLTETPIPSASSASTSAPVVSSPALSALKSALTAIVSSSASSGPPSQKNSQLINALVASLKSLGSGSSAGNALVSLLDPKKNQNKGEVGKCSSSTEVSATPATTSATNIAALAVIAAAVAAAKGKLNSKKPESAGGTSFSGQDAAVVKALEDFLATALPALSNLQKQQLAPSSSAAPVAPAAAAPAPTEKSSSTGDITLEDLFDTDALESDGPPDDNDHGIEELDLSDPFSRWTKVPILTFRKSRRPSLSKVAKNDFKKAFRNAKHSPTMTLPSAPPPPLTDYSGSYWKSPKFTNPSADYEPNALLQIPPFPNIPHFPSPLLPANHGFLDGGDIPELNINDLFHGGFQAQTGDNLWVKKKK
ncbi:UNVERIFIED_CONTAM: hypothetical protein HDU68_001271 [Siphonaria sp. JEL0065]|nr:hypothetical protein HDU68_001271 [Siphonaria sp. JEL0065]